MTETGLYHFQFQLWNLSNIDYILEVSSKYHKAQYWATSISDKYSCTRSPTEDNYSEEKGNGSLW